MKNYREILEGETTIRKILDKAFVDKKDYIVADTIVKFIEKKFAFRPGFSNFKEIIIEFLEGSLSKDSVNHISKRYQMSKRESKMVITVLQKNFKQYIRL